MVTRTTNPFGLTKDLINLIRSVEGNVSHAEGIVHSLLSAAEAGNLDTIPQPQRPVYTVVTGQQRPLFESSIPILQPKTLL